MPDPALPIPRPTPRILPGSVPLRHTWVDSLGRPLAGRVTLTAPARIGLGDYSIPPAPVTVDLVDGVLDVMLPPGAYRMTADLRLVDGTPVTDSGTLTLPPPA